MAKASNTKQKICDCAKRLFNEKGYDQVSLREIADAAGTTIGNFTYHFPLKENLIAAIQQDLHAGFANSFFIAQAGEAVLINLLQSFHDIQTNEENNPFYFRNLVELCKDSADISRTNEEFRKKLHRYYFDSLMMLKAHGFVRSDVSDGQYTNFSYVIVVMASVWIQNTSPFYDEDLPHIPIAAAMTDLLTPYLTQRGAQVLSDFQPNQQV